MIKHIQKSDKTIQKSDKTIQKVIKPIQKVIKLLATPRATCDCESYNVFDNIYIIIYIMFFFFKNPIIQNLKFKFLEH